MSTPTTPANLARINKMFNASDALLRYIPEILDELNEKAIDEE